MAKRYVPKPGPAAPFAIVLAVHGGRCEVVAVAAPPDRAQAAHDAALATRPRLHACTFVIDRIAAEVKR
jgi:hypothetical protein